MIEQPTATELERHRMAIARLRELIFGSRDPSSYGVVGERVLEMSIETIVDIDAVKKTSRRVIQLGGIELSINAGKAKPVILGISHHSRDRFETHVYDHDYNGARYTALVGTCTAKELHATVWRDVEMVKRR